MWFVATTGWLPASTLCATVCRARSNRCRLFGRVTGPSGQSEWLPMKLQQLSRSCCSPAMDVAGSEGKCTPIPNSHLDLLHDVTGDDTENRGEEVRADQPYEVHEQLSDERALAEDHHACGATAATAHASVKLSHLYL